MISSSQNTSYYLSKIFIFQIKLVQMCQTQNITFDLSIHLVDQQGDYLFTKGFIHNQVHLSASPYPQCEFKLEPKNYLLHNNDRKSNKNQTVVFGTQILIRHIFSNLFLSIELAEDGNQIIKLRPDYNQNCNFEILPQRTFEHKGDCLNFQSFFVIRHAIYKCYLGSNLLETGKMKQKMERQLKTSKIKQSYKKTNQKDFSQVDNPFKLQPNNKSFCVESMNFIQDQWKVRQQLAGELIKTDKKLKSIEYIQEPQIQRQHSSKSIILPLKSSQYSQQPLRQCIIQKHIHTMWQAKKISKTSHPFLSNNSYIYFISSNKNRGLMNISIKRDQQPEIEFVKNQGENEYICSAVFKVQIVDRQQFYLRHLLTGKYFPFTPQNSKKCLKLKPLLPYNKMEQKLPPFHLLYQNAFYPRSIEEDASTCGFWLNTADKLEINEILSLEGLPQDQWVPYLLNYLDTNRKRRQQILQEFNLIRFLIQKLINSSQQSQDVYKLLFKMINNNNNARKQVTQYLSSNILQSNKNFIMNILSELFDNEMGFVQKYINPQQLGYILKDFILEDTYSVIYMRIFRLFCGHHTQPCQRNQNLIFNFFFHSQAIKRFSMSQSVFNLKRQVQVPNKFKFMLKKQKETILFENIDQCRLFGEYPLQVQQYIRQYYYLLGDCMKLNKQNIETFKQQFGSTYSLQMLLDILQCPTLQQLKGPILHLLNACYLQPEYRYKLYVFINDYESMCYNGKMIALHRDQKICRLIKYINREVDSIRAICDQIDQKTNIVNNLKHDSEELNGCLNDLYKQVQDQFKSTKFKHFLLMVKFSIENAYWQSEDIVLHLVDTVGRFYSKKRSISATIHSNYEQINQWKNYMESTIIAIDIAILFIDIQINLALSHLITLPQNKANRINDKIVECARKIENNEQIRKYFSQFQICDHQNSKLIKKSLVLSRKFYQIKMILNEKYSEAINQRVQSSNLRQSIEIIKGTLHDIKLSNQNSIQVCQQYILQSLPGIKIDDLSPHQILKKGYILNAVCRYKQPFQEFQILAYRLGVLEILKEQLWRYVNLRGKQKLQQQLFIYWKVLLLYILIKDNKELKKEVSKWRRWIIGLVKQDQQRDGQISIVVLDILEQIYRNNRGLIVSDSDQILTICEQFIKLIGKDNTNYLGSNPQLNTKLNRLLNLLSIFLTVGGRKIKNNFQLIVNQIFDKQNIIKCIIKLRNMDHFQHLKSSFVSEDHSEQFHNNILFKLLLFVLAQTLEQNPSKVGFDLPDISHIINLILAVGRNNWNLTFKMYNLIHPKHLVEEFSTLSKIFQTHLNTAIQLIYQYIHYQPKEVSSYFGYSPQIKAFLKNFTIILKIGKIMIEYNKIKGKSSYFAQFSQIQSFQKLQIIQRICLLSSYVPSSYRQELFQIIFQNANELRMTKQQLQPLRHLNIKDITIDHLKNNKISFLSITNNMETAQHHYERWTKESDLSKHRSFIQQNILSSKFRINEAKQFIRSIMQVNKSDSSILDTQLKIFFISFLTSTFPENDRSVQYSSQLKDHQNLLIQYGTAQLITTILQQKYRQNRVLFINIFQLANRLLEGGSVTAQQRFLSIFKEDQKNSIFESIATIIESSLIGIRFYYQQDDTYECQDEGAIELQRKQVCETLKKAFRFLQLLCQNDNQDLKKYILSQTNASGVVKYMSINFIETAIHLLLQVSSYSLNQLQREHPLFTPLQIEQNLLNCLSFIFDFLVEVCQYPALDNQKYLCNSDFFNILKVINNLSKLQKNLEKQMSGQIFTLQRKVVLLMRGLLQQRNEEIINNVCQKVKQEYLKYLVLSSLNSIGVTSVTDLRNYLHTKEDKLIEQIQNVVDIIIVSKVLGFTIVHLFQDNYQEVLNQIQGQIRQIEVDFKGKITKIYFCYRPIFDYLSQSTRAFFLSRSSVLQSRNEKLRQLINLRLIVNQDIVSRKSRQLVISQNTINYLFILSIILCFVLLGLQLFFYSINNSGISLDSIEDSIIHGVAVMEFLITGIYCSLWGINISSITKQKMKAQYKIQTILKKSRVKYYYLLVRQIYLQESSSLHATLLFTLSLISCWFDVRLYSLVLLYLFAKIQTLGNILTAIRLTWARLLVVCLLATAFTFVFGFLSINNYVQVLYENQSVDVDIGQIESHCTSIIGCIDSLYTQRIIGETPSREGQTSHYGRFFSDTIHWAFFDILFTNIVAAIIIDKFAQLRNIKQKIENQQRNRCFICSGIKSSIERTDQDFQQHISKKHCLWNYFFYLYYLQKLKDTTEYTGIQYWIVRQVKENKIDWFPSDEALKEDDQQKKFKELFDKFALQLQKSINDSNSSNKL